MRLAPPQSREAAPAPRKSAARRTKRTVERRAERITRGPAGETIQRKCGSCGRDEERAQRKSTAVESGTEVDGGPAESVVASDGVPLARSVRNYFEPRFGHDFASVRIHTGAAASAAAKSIHARAFTIGNHLVFNSGEYSPNGSAGRHLIAHELAHVVQQRAGVHGVQRILQRKCAEGEGPPAPEPPIPSEPGSHPLIYRGTTTKRSRRPAVGDAQGLLNQFLSRLKAGTFPCKPGADKAAIEGIRATLNQDPLDVDCRFGPNTEKATKMFQQCVFPKQRDQWDGKIGKNTWAELDTLRAGPAPGPAPSPAPKPKKPGAQTPCERTCESDFARCLNQSQSPLACIAARNACLSACPANQASSFAVCARRLQPPVEISGCNHAYVETPTRRYAIITPCTDKFSFAIPPGGIAIKTDVSPDPCGRETRCVECTPKPGVTDLEACFAAQFAAYAAPSRHFITGPNSNTFAGTLARACCSNMIPKPAALGCTPGWDDPPAPAAPTNECPPGPPVC